MTNPNIDAFLLRQAIMASVDFDDISFARTKVKLPSSSCLLLGWLLREVIFMTSAAIRQLSLPVCVTGMARKKQIKKHRI